MMDLLSKSGPDVFSPDWLLLAVALVLIAAPFNYEQPLLGSGWLATLAYPRLFGAGLIWMTIIKRMTTSQDNRDGLAG